MWQAAAYSSGISPWPSRGGHRASLPAECAHLPRGKRGFPSEACVPLFIVRLFANNVKLLLPSRHHPYLPRLRDRSGRQRIVNNLRLLLLVPLSRRSEERRVGKECRS